MRTRNLFIISTILLILIGVSIKMTLEAYSHVIDQYYAHIVVGIPLVLIGVFSIFSKIKADPRWRSSGILGTLALVPLFGIVGMFLLGIFVINPKIEQQERSYEARQEAKKERLKVDAISRDFAHFYFLTWDISEEPTDDQLTAHYERASSYVEKLGFVGEEAEEIIYEATRVKNLNGYPVADGRINYRIREIRQMVEIVMTLNPAAFESIVSTQAIFESPNAPQPAELHKLIKGVADSTQKAVAQFEDTQWLVRALDSRKETAIRQGASTKEELAYQLKKSIATSKSMNSKVKRFLEDYYSPPVTLDQFIDQYLQGI